MAANAETVKAIQEVQELLGSLEDRVPGTRLRAEDWNGLVDAVSGLARLGVMGTEEEPPAPVEIPSGSVRFDHLADEVRRLLETGPYGDAKDRLSRITMDKRLGAVEKQISGQSDRIEGLVGALGDTEISVIRGLNDVKTLGHQVDGLGVLQQEVGDLRGILGSVRDDLQVALEAADDLAGVELGALQGRVEALDAFRLSWLDENENAVGLEGILRRLEEIQSNAIDDRRLGEAVDARLATFDVNPDAIAATVTSTVRADLEVATTELRSEVDRLIAEQTDVVLGRVNEEVGRAVLSELGDLDARIADVASVTATRVVGESIDESIALLRQELDLEFDQKLVSLKTDVEQQLGEFRGEVDDRFDRFDRETINQAALDEAILASEARMRLRSDELETRMSGESLARADGDITLRRERAEAIAGSNSRTDSLLSDATRREAVERDGAIQAAAAATVTALRLEISGLESGLTSLAKEAAASAVDGRFDSARAELERRLQIIVNDATAALESDIDKLRSKIGDRSSVVRPDGPLEPIDRLRGNRGGVG